MQPAAPARAPRAAVLDDHVADLARRRRGPSSACRRGSARRRRPVPQKTPRIESYGLPAPSLNSALVATSTSLPIRTCAPSASASVAPSGNVPSQSGQVARLGDVAGLARRRRPGEPTPTPASESVCTPAASAASTSALAISAATSAGPPSVGVGRRASPMTSPSGVDDRRLDLGPAEVDAPAQRVLAGSRMHRRESIPGVRRSASARARAAAVPAPRSPHAAGAERRAHRPDRRLVWVGSPVVCAARGRV